MQYFDNSPFSRTQAEPLLKHGMLEEMCVMRHFCTQDQMTIVKTLRAAQTFLFSCPPQRVFNVHVKGSSHFHPFKIFLGHKD